METTKDKITENNEVKWYAIHTYSGYENTVKRNLLQRVEALGISDKIFEVLIPQEVHVTVKGNKKVEKTENIYPGYVLVKMIANKETWFVVRNTPRVTGFVGSGTDPVPLSQEEVDRILNITDKKNVNYNSEFSKGDRVQVVSGPFKDSEGKIEDVYKEEFKAKVLLPMFGRETGITLDFSQIRKI